MSLLRILCLSMLVSCASLSAQTKDAAAQPKEKSPARSVRFLALGESPPFEQEVRDGVRYELEPPADSIPPRQVVVGFGKDKAEPASLRLGQVSEPLKIPAGTGPLLLGLPGDAKDAEPWLRLVRPEAGDFLVLLWRDAKQGSWKKAKSMVLPDDAITAPAGSVRFINISPATVGIRWGDENLALEPGKLFHRVVPEGVDQPFEVMLTTVTGEWKRLYGGAVVQNTGERSLVLIYLADGVEPRLPLKVTVQRELAPVPPKDEKGSTKTTPTRDKP